MVLASDGLWKQRDEEKVVSDIEELWQRGMSPNEIAGIFLCLAFIYLNNDFLITRDTLTEKLAGSQGADNVTVVVVFFVSISCFSPTLHQFRFDSADMG